MDSCDTGLMSFPDEILLHIFRYLPLHDRKSAKLVCRRWLDLNRDKSLTKTDVTVITNPAELLEIASSNEEYKILNLRIHVVEGTENNLFDGKCLNFWDLYGLSIKSVVLKYTAAHGILGLLVKLFKYCINLENLSLWFEPDFNRYNGFFCRCSDNPVSIDTSRLKSLYILEIPCGHVLTSLIAGGTSIESLTLRNCKYGLHRHPIMENLLKFVQKQKATLKEFCIDTDIYHYATNEHGQTFEYVSIIGPELTELRALQWWRDANTDFWVSSTGHRLTNLKKFCLRYEFTDNTTNHFSETFLSFFSSLSKLTHVYFHNLTGSLNDTNLPLLDLPNLISLRLYQCNLTDAGITSLLGRKIFPKIKHLNLSGIVRITDDSIIAIAPNLPNIRALYLEKSPRLTAYSLKAISSHCQNLQVLSIVECRRMEHSDWTSFVNELTKLQHLDLMSSPLETTSLSDLRLQWLLHIRLSSSRYIVSTDFGRTIFANCPSLRYILEHRTGSPGTSPFGWGHPAIGRNLASVYVLFWADRGWEDGVPCVTRR